MNILLDTCILLWIATDSPKLSAKSRTIILEPNNNLYFSVASFWEITIKNNLQKEGFKIDVKMLRNSLINNGYLEINLDANHILALAKLPNLHKDPFDRILIAQAIYEDLCLLTADAKLSNYGDFILQN